MTSAAWRNRTDGSVSFGDPLNWRWPEQWERVHVLTDAELQAERARVWDAGEEAGGMNEQNWAGSDFTRPFILNPYKEGASDE